MQNLKTSILLQESYAPSSYSVQLPSRPFFPAVATAIVAPQTPAQPAAEPAQPVQLVPYPGTPVLSEMLAKFSRDPVAVQRLELKAVEHYEQQLKSLKTPAQFQAQTVQLKQQIAEGASLEEIRPQAYALARVAAEAVLGKRPYDSQLLGALSMDNSTIAQMGTGEGKTLTALMPLFLNSLAGKGSHLVTVNDYLAQAGFDELKPVFDTLGVKAGVVLKEMTPEQKREGYNADVTYLSNDTLGFDFLGDRTAKSASERVQRQPFFALLDEADQVLLDEALVPLIIAGEQSSESLEEARTQGKMFQRIVANLIPGQDFLVDLKARSASLTELGEEILANELAIAELSMEDPAYADKLAAGVHLRKQIRQGASANQEQVNKNRALLPAVDLYSDDNIGRVGALQSALEARCLYKLDTDYAVKDGQVQIIDEFKGRISEGRRFMQGLHQALEIKEGLQAQPETHTVASITYPNLFRRYERLAGMTGTAASASKELSESLGLETIVVPPNRPSQRVDRADAVFATRQEKIEALVAETQKAFEEGVPVLVATRSVEMNRYISALLQERGIANQSLNAEDVKTNTPQENALVAQAGRSGVVTVATNMAGRGVDIKPDAVNYKKLAITADAARLEGKAVVVQLDPKKPEQAERLAAWFSADANDPVPFRNAVEGDRPQAGQVLITTSEIPVGPNVLLLKGEDFPGKKLVVLASEHNMEKRIDDQLRGRAGRQGAPGETQFFVSLEDDLLRSQSKSDLEKLSKKLAKGQVDDVRAAIAEAQEKVEQTNADGRFATAQFDKVANTQREYFWNFRDNWVDNKPGSLEANQLVNATVKEWLSESFNKAVEAQLEDAKHPSQSELEAAVQAASAKFQLTSPIQVATGKSDWKVRVGQALENHFETLQSGLNQDALASSQWQTVTSKLDLGWTDQLQALEDARDNSSLKTFIGKEPEQAFKEEAYTSFDQMWAWVKESASMEILSAMQNLAKA